MDIENKKINLFIGLSQIDMKTKNSKATTLNLVSKELINIGVLGFNVSTIKGYWNAEQETAVLISFINTFNVDYAQLKIVVATLKDKLKQESILITIEPTTFEFI